MHIISPLKNVHANCFNKFDNWIWSNYKSILIIQTCQAADSSCFLNFRVITEYNFVFNSRVEYLFFVSLQTLLIVMLMKLETKVTSGAFINMSPQGFYSRIKTASNWVTFINSVSSDLQANFEKRIASIKWNSLH